MDQNGSSSIGAVVTSAWVQETVARCQELAGHVADAPVRTFVATVASLGRELPNPRNAAEYFVERSLLLDIAITLGSQLHNRFHGPIRHQCRFDSGALAARVWKNRAKSPAELLVEWAHSVVTELDSEPQHFHDAQRWVVENYDQSFTLASVARRFDVKPQQLERSFKVYVGLTFKKYHRGVKLVRALEMLVIDGVKIDAVALLVGFRSKKNFYQAFDSWFRTTPGKLRSLAPPDCDQFGFRVPSAFRSTVNAILHGHHNKALYGEL